MYVRRYSSAQDEKSIVRVPENYAGNAFREDTKEEEPRANEHTDPPPRAREMGRQSDLSQKEGEKEGNSLLPFFSSKLLSSDTLLLLLAFLLMGNGECEDLPGILIFLMLL